MRISKDDLRNAARICFRSANELLEDARLLETMHRYARAVYLACIGIEELGKAKLSLDLSQLGDEPEFETFLKFWHHHQSKIAHGQGFTAFDPEKLQAIVPNLVPPGYKDWYDYDKKKRDFFAVFSRITSDLKLGSLYVDMKKADDKSAKLKFSLPSYVIKSHHARIFVQDLEGKIKDLRQEISSLGPFHLPPYDTGEIYDYNEI